MAVDRPRLIADCEAMKRVFLPLALLSAQAPAPSPAPIEPAGPWTVEGQDGLCLLSRLFGTGGNQITVGFEPQFDSPKSLVIVLSPDTDHALPPRKASVSVHDGGAAINGDVDSAVLRDRHLRFTRLSVDATLLDRIKASPTLTFNYPRAVTVHLANFTKAMAALDGCQDKLLHSWGITDVQIADMKGSRLQVAGDVLNTFGPASYPREAISKNQQGRDVAILWVNPAGQVETCRVATQVAPSLDAATCAFARRLRFRQRSDVTHASVYVLPVRWVLPAG